jgi:hypothetical protein
MLFSGLFVNATQRSAASSILLLNELSRRR